MAEYETDDCPIEPQIYVVSRQVIDRAELRRFLEDEEAPSWYSDTAIPAQELVEIAGRLCYNSFNKPRPGGNQSYIKHIIDVGHGSVLEHATWSFIITGVSRSLSHEWIRHRAGVAISQASQRYIDESKANFILPQTIEEDSVLSRLSEEYLNIGRDFYKKIVDTVTEKLTAEHMLTNDRPMTTEEKTHIRKMARQSARSILPNATETKIFWTANARTIRNVLEQRASKYAEVEIRRLSNRLYEVMLNEAPHMFSDYQKIPMSDGTYELKTVNRKV